MVCMELLLEGCRDFLFLVVLWFCTWFCMYHGKTRLQSMSCTTDDVHQTAYFVIHTAYSLFIALLQPTHRLAHSLAHSLTQSLGILATIISNVVQERPFCSSATAKPMQRPESPRCRPHNTRKVQTTKRRECDGCRQRLVVKMIIFPMPMLRSIMMQDATPINAIPTWGLLK